MSVFYFVSVYLTLSVGIGANRREEARIWLYSTVFNLRYSNLIYRCLQLSFQMKYIQTSFRHLHMLTCAY